jgi:hypothetical protein
LNRHYAAAPHQFLPSPSRAGDFFAETMRFADHRFHFFIRKISSSVKFTHECILPSFT